MIELAKALLLLVLLGLLYLLSSQLSSAVLDFGKRTVSRFT